MKNTGKGIRELAGEFIAQEDTKVETQRFDAYVLDIYFKYLVVNRIDVNKASRANIVAYKRFLIDDGKKPTTIDKYIGLVRRFYNWLEINGLYENIARNIHKVKRYKGYRKSYLTRDEIIYLLGMIDVSTLQGLRDFAMINLMIMTGIRRCEVNRLNVSDVNNDSIMIMRKGKIERKAIGVNDSVIVPIRDYLSRASLADNSPLFISLSRKNKGKRLSVTDISIISKVYLRMIRDDEALSCHSFRHSFAINALKGGATIFEVQNALDHETSETTKIYLSMIEEETKEINPAHSAISNYVNNGLKTA